MQTHPPARPRWRRALVPAAVVGAAVTLVGFNLSKTQLSLPVRSAVGRVEESPAVRAALGEPVHVERFGDLPLRRYTLRERNVDVLSFRARVVGARARGELELLVRNEDDQGWAGTYTVRTAPRSVLRDGAYAQEPTRTIVEGRFDREGRALAPAPAAP